ncbi:hypothetical protein C8Q76DRAFT_619845, partial [Earliella scabrosa]
AVFHTAAVWRWNSHLETGNFVPTGETAPARLSEFKIQSVPSNICQVEYVISTEHDKSIFDCQKKFETVFVGATGFNKANKPRRNWQLGREPYTRSFTFTSQIFQKVNKNTGGNLSEPYRLHPWVANIAKSSDWMPNPERPGVYDLTNSKLLDILDANPPYIRRDDLVWMSFRIRVIFGSDSWFPAFIPVDVVRVDVVPSPLRELRDEALGQVVEVAPVKRSLKAGGTYVVSK